MMANLKSKTLLSALALAGSLLITTAAFANTATPPAPTEQPATEPIAPAALPLPTAVPPVSMEDDRRILRGNHTITGDNFTLRSGETLRGDLTIFGGNATLEENSIVEGSVAIFGGNVDIAGTVTGDVSLVGGSALLRNSAVVDGDLSRIAGAVNREAGAVVRGDWTTMGEPSASSNNARVVRNVGPLGRFFSFITSAIVAVLGAIAISLLAIAIVALLPNHVAQAAATLQASWLTAGVVGALTLFAVPILALTLAITICLIPISLLLMLAYAAAVIAGWTVSARIIGERVMRAMNRHDWTLVGQTLAGAVLLALLGSVPVIGGLIAFVATALGLGALMLTRAGTRRYPMLAPAGPIAPMPDGISAPRAEQTSPTSDMPAAMSPATSAPETDWWKTNDAPSSDAPPAVDTSPDVTPPDQPA